MKVAYHPAVQKDVSSILRHDDSISPRLGDEFWAELNAGIARVAENPLRFHPAANGLRRFNFIKFPHTFFIAFCPDGSASRSSGMTNNIPGADWPGSRHPESK